MASLRDNRNKPPEENAEKTANEKFEAEVKEVVFGVLSVLLKDGDSSFISFIIRSIIESIQMYKFVFDERWPWNIENAAKYLYKMFNSFELGM